MMKNMIVILADQLRRQALGCYGDPNVATPNIDALAAQGTRFVNSCSSYPVCVPFRFTLMTGEYAHTRKVPSIHFHMEKEERSLADPFNAAAYHTAYFGKWHLEGCEKKAPVPRDHQARWQKWCGFELCNDHFKSFYYEDDDPQMKQIEGYQTDGLFQLCADYLCKDRPADKPFFSILSVEPPHFPYQAPEADLERWRGRDLTLPQTFQQEPDYYTPVQNWDPPEEADTEGRLERLRIYYAMIENLDRNIGQLRQHLEEAGLADNTIIALIADHGEMGGMHNYPTAMKETSFEESIGIPFIVYDPTDTTPRTPADVVGTEDLFPTFCGLCDVEVPQGLPGIDCSDLIGGRIGSLERDGILLEAVDEKREYGTFWQQSMRGIRTRRYKYTMLKGSQDGRYDVSHIAAWQLFDLEADPLEQKNLIDDPSAADLQQEMHQRLLALLEEADDSAWLQQGVV